TGKLQNRIEIRQKSHCSRHLHRLRRVRWTNSDRQATQHQSNDMNTMELDSILAADCNLAIIYAGTFACDMLPSTVDHPAAIVANADPSSMPGSHWIAFYIDEKERGEYFDSYGD